VNAVRRIALTIGIAALLAGCGESQPPGSQHLLPAFAPSVPRLSGSVQYFSNDSAYGNNIGQKNTPSNDVQATVVVGDDGIYCRPHLDYWAYPRRGDPKKMLQSGPARPRYDGVSIAS
jgi:hypothetical protein